MKAIALVFVTFLATELAFGQEDKFQIGASLGSNIGLSRSRINMEDIDRQPGVGGSASAIVMYSIDPRINLTGQLGGVIERFGTERHTDSDLDYDWKYSWAEATGIISYLPLVNEKFDVFTGIGFTARRLLKAKLNGELIASNGNRLEISDFSVYGQTHTWNYLLPVQGGLNFHLPSGSSIQTSAEVQIGLRDRWNYPGSAGDGLPNERLLGIGLKVGYLFKV